MGIKISTGVATYSGIAATRPAATTVPIGAVYFATDTGVISRSDGNAWATIPVGAGSLGTDSVGADEISAGAVGNTELAGGVLTADKLAAAQRLTAAGSISASGSQDVILATSGVTYKLPAAVAGLRFRIWTEFGNSNGYCTLQRSDAPGTDLFDGGVSSIEIHLLSMVEVFCRADGTWVFYRRPGDQAGTVDFDSTSSSGAGDKLVTTLAKGDGKHAIMVEAYLHVNSNGAAATQVYAELRDGAGGTGNLLGKAHFNSAGASYGHLLRPTALITPNTAAAKVVRCYLNNSAGVPTTYEAAIGSINRVIRPTWTNILR